MLVRFFLMLRDAGVPATIPELLSLLESLRAGVGEASAEHFYFLARACLVKDERYYDRFDRAFAAHFRGVQEVFAVLARELPADWLTQLAEAAPGDEERAVAGAQAGWEQLLRTLQQRLEEQHSRHEGGAKWIGTAGTSPYGAYGYNTEGVRIGEDRSRNRSAAKVWDQREFASLDDTRELGTRNMKLALRRLRRFARRGAATELSLGDTIDATARSGGWLDLKMVPERRNVVKVLLLLDVGGSMDPYVRSCEELFSAARSEFKHLEQYYFHNFTYESLWRGPGRQGSGRRGARVPTAELLRSFARDYKLILVGDATMSPYEITEPGGSVEHWNAEPGRVWLQRLRQAFPDHAWINPQPQSEWHRSASIDLTRRLLEDRMFPMTLAGLDAAIDALS